MKKNDLNYRRKNNKSTTLYTIVNNNFKNEHFNFSINIFAHRQRIR